MTTIACAGSDGYPPNRPLLPTPHEKESQTPALCGHNSLIGKGLGRSRVFATPQRVANTLGAGRIYTQQRPIDQGSLSVNSSPREVDVRRCGVPVFAIVITES